MLLLPILIAALASLATANSLKPQSAAAARIDPYKLRQAKRADILRRKQSGKLRPRSSLPACTTDVRDTTGACCTSGLYISYDNHGCCKESEVYENYGRRCCSLSDGKQFVNGQCVCVRNSSGGCCLKTRVYTPAGSTAAACCEAPNVVKDGMCVPAPYCSTGVIDSIGTCCTSGLNLSYEKDGCCKATDIYTRLQVSPNPSCCDQGTPFKEDAGSPGLDNCCYGELYKTGDTTQSCCAGFSARIYDISPSKFKGCCSQSGVLTGSGTEDNPAECCYTPVYQDSLGINQCCKVSERYNIRPQDGDLCCPSREGKKLIDAHTCVDA